MLTQKVKFDLRWVENIVGKGENAGYQHFLSFAQISRDFYPRVVKSCYCGVNVNEILL